VDTVGGPVVLAANEMSAGTAGLITVLLLCVASALIFYFMSGSLKRMRGHVQEGDFAAANARRLAAKAARSGPVQGQPAKPVVVPAQPTGDPAQSSGPDS
jgi:hypothetical protein